MGQLPFQLRAREPVGNAAALPSGGVVHRLAGFAIENRTRRPVAQCLVQPFLVIKAQPAADALARLRNRAIRFDEGEWRGASQPRALSEPDVNLAIHPAPIIQPLAPGSSGRTWWGCAA
jgi:hypothetical protein